MKNIKNIKKNFLFFIFFATITFLFLFLLKGSIYALSCPNGCCDYGVVAYEWGFHKLGCTACCGGGSEGGGDIYKNPPEGVVDVINCNEVRGWACDPSCTGEEPPCATKIDIKRLRRPIIYTITPTIPRTRFRINNCVSCDWGGGESSYVSNPNKIFCGDCPGSCSSLKCAINPIVQRIGQIYANQERNDLKKVPACKGTTKHGFSFTWPNNPEGTDLVNLYPDRENRIFVIALNQGTGYHTSLTYFGPVRNNKGYTLTCQLPTCSVSINKSSVARAESNTLVVNFNGKAYNKNIRLWVRRKDLQSVSQLANVATVYQQENPTRFYYLVKECNPGNFAGCSGSFTLPNNLPIGEYVVHCDTDSTAGRRCSGNSRCTYEGNPYQENPLFDCEDWRSCSNSDNALFTVVTPPTFDGNIIIDADNNSESVKPGHYPYSSHLSGMRINETALGSQIKGSNYYNYLVVGQKINSNIPSSADNIGLSGVIFTQRNINLSSLNFDQVKTNVRTNKGFILLYANKTYTQANSPIGEAVAFDNYYFYTPDKDGNYKWHEKSQGEVLRIEQGDNLMYKVIGVFTTSCMTSVEDNIFNRPQLPCFHLYLYNPFIGSVTKTYGTYGYIYDHGRGVHIYSSDSSSRPKQ